MTEPSGGRAGTVALVGWTNVGKSTLLNRLLGTKLAAVADAAQTTRHRILGVLHLPGASQIAFVDLPGVHRPRSRMNHAMLRLVQDTLRNLDAVLLVVDAARGIGPGDREAAELVRRAPVPRLLVLNKIDEVRPKHRLLPIMHEGVEEWGCAEALPVSARTGAGCPELVARLLLHLPQGEPLFPEDFLTDQSERRIAEEWIREQLLQRTRQEIPHATAVVVERWHDREDGLIAIEAAILVDRESQKAIVIGRGGELLKQAGSAARVELEALLGRRVFLRLTVRTRADWRNDEQWLREVGLA